MAQRSRAYMLGHVTKREEKKAKGQRVRALRLALGQAPADVEARGASQAAIEDIRFQTQEIGKFERDGTGSTSSAKIGSFAAGLGLKEEDFKHYLLGHISLAQAVKLSMIVPDPAKVKELTEQAEADEARRIMDESRYGDLPEWETLVGKARQIHAQLDSPLFPPAAFMGVESMPVLRPVTKPTPMVICGAAGYWWWTCSREEQQEAEEMEHVRRIDNGEELALSKPNLPSGSFQSAKRASEPKKAR